MDQKFSSGGEAEVITKLVMTPVSRKNLRWLTVLLGFFLVLMVPCAWAAQDLSDMKLKAEQGDAAAQIQLGFTYEHGKGVPQDYKEAVKWYLKAAEQGNAIGQFNLGVMYEHGKGVPQDYEEALNWYRKAAEQATPQGRAVWANVHPMVKALLRITGRQSNGIANPQNRVLPKGSSIWASCTSWQGRCPGLQRGH